MYKGDSKIQNTKGITLIELMIVLSLLGIVLAGIYNLFFFVTVSFNRSDAQASVLQQMNLFSSRISAEIRSAQEPNSKTNAVVVKAESGYGNGQIIDIYRYNSSSGKYERIQYRLLSSDKSKLQRGVAICNGTPPDTANPNYETIHDWETVVDGVVYKKGITDIVIFKDITSVTDSDRRTIELNLSANDTEKSLPKPVTIYTAATSRSISAKK